MAIAVNEITTASVPYGTPATTLTIAKPANVANDDVLAAFIMKSDDSVISMPIGWVQTDQTRTTLGIDMATIICYKIISNAGGEPADYTWTADGDEGWAGGIVRLTGVDTTIPNDAANSQTDGANWDGAQPCPSMTTATNDALVFAFFALGYDVTVPSAPADTTSAIEVLNGVAIDPLSSNALVSYFIQASAGATPTRLWSFDTYDSGAEWHAYQCAFRPAAAGALEVNVSDSGVVSESVISLFPLLLTSISESISVVESVTALLPLLEVSVSESMIATESITPVLPLLEAPISESILVAESVTPIMPLLQISISEDAVVIESVAPLFPLLEANVSESAVVTESVTAQLPLYEVVEYESVVVTESVIVNTGVFEASVSESIVVIESITSSLPLYEVSVLETIIGADIVTAKIVGFMTAYYYRSLMQGMCK